MYFEDDKNPISEIKSSNTHEIHMELLNLKKEIDKISQKYKYIDFGNMERGMENIWHITK